MDAIFITICLLFFITLFFITFFSYIRLRYEYSKLIDENFKIIDELISQQYEIKHLREHIKNK